MILDLVAAGKKVGVTANSHKVIGNLLDEVSLAVRDDPEFAGRTVRIGQKPGDDGVTTGRWAEPMPNGRALDALAAGEVDVVGATSWLWASDNAIGAVDVIFIDEAGQFSLANAVAVSPAAESLVLLGDPQQLDQPLKGTHPIGADRSALAHLLDGAAVMPEELGLFMKDTWRLHPRDLRLHVGGLLRGQAAAARRKRETGAQGHRARERRGHPVRPRRPPAQRQSESLHRGGSRSSRDSSATCSMAVPHGRTAMDMSRRSRRQTSSSSLHTTHSASSSARSWRRFGDACRSVAVGTVDKFQGQQAPISIYSMASSTPEDAPRGMEFLYSRNRLNVATSRARCLTLVVASPALVRARARSPRQMVLANALCRLDEMAR